MHVQKLRFFIYRRVSDVESQFYTCASVRAILEQSHCISLVLYTK